MNTKPRSLATLIGFCAVLLWSLLALFTVGSAPVPPLLLNAMCFAIAGGIGIVWLAMTGGVRLLAGTSWKVYAFGTAGLFGYHFLYFSALRMAPPAQAGLIAYLWPLLIVLFSGLLPGERLGRGHLAGAGLAFLGAALVVVDRTETAATGALHGFGLAFLCALTWSGYSVISRRLGAVPTGSVAVFCVFSALLSAAAHLVLEEPAWPTNTLGWASVMALGIGPVGLAFYVWDIGVKRGDIQLLGVAAYAAPLLSTLVLVLAGLAEPRATLFAAAVLIAGGAALAARASARIVRPDR